MYYLKAVSTKFIAIHFKIFLGMWCADLLFLSIFALNAFRASCFAHTFSRKSRFYPHSFDYEPWNHS